MESRSSLRLTRIRMYPLKGAAGFDLQEAESDPLGLHGDRRWMLASTAGNFFSQRTHPRLSLIRTAPDEEGAGGLSFLLQAPGLGSLRLSPEGLDTWQEVRVHEDRFPARVGCQEADRWFSGFLGEPCRLAFIPDETFRPTDPEWAPGHRVSMADGYPLHLSAEESLQDLNGRLGRPSSMLSFRPNLVVAGGSSWEEDEWRVLEMGGARIRMVKPCARCSVTTVDQGTGLRGKEPLRTLRAFRQWEGKTYFGQNAVIDVPGRFRVGDNVHILEKGPRRPPIPV